MFILFGTKGVEEVWATGQFLCPRCRKQRGYRRVSVQRHAHVFFISIFPLGMRAQYVECRSCRATYHPEVLLTSRTDGQIRAEFEKAIVAVTILMARADRDLEHREMNTIGTIFREVTGDPLTDEFLDAQIEVREEMAFQPEPDAVPPEASPKRSRP